MARKNRTEECTTRVFGSVLDTDGRPIESIRFALLQDHRILVTAATDHDGGFTLEASGATHLAWSSFSAAPGNMFLSLAGRHVMEVPRDITEGWDVSAIRMQRIQGEDCVVGERQILKVSSCGEPVDSYPLVGLDESARPLEVVWTHDGTARFSGAVKAIAPASMMHGDDGATYRYSGTPIAYVKDLNGEVNVDSDSTKAWVTGRVVTDCGEPIGGVCVLLLDSHKVLVADGKAETNAQGEFRFDADGDYVVFGKEHRDACSKCCLHLVTDAIVAIPLAVKCGKRTVPTAIYDGCCLVKPQPSGKIVRGKVLDNCNTVLNDACVLLMKNGQPVAWTKTVGGGYEFDEDGDTVVFCPEFIDRGRSYELLTPTLVALPCPNSDGVREAPAAIYSGHCVREAPPVVTSPLDRTDLEKLYGSWKELQQTTKAIRGGITSVANVFPKDRKKVLDLLDGVLAAIERELGAVKVQFDSSGATDAAFVAGSRKVFAALEGQLRRIAFTARDFSSQGQEQILSARKVFSVFEEFAQIGEGGKS